MKVLVAEDDALSRRVLTRALEGARHTVQVVEDGNAALAAIQASTEPLIALLDWMMPGMDGVDVCRRVRSNLGTARPYLIIVSAKSDKTDIAAGLDAGADDFISKPIHSEELLARMRVAERTLNYQLELQKQIEKFEALAERYNLLGEIVAHQLQPGEDTVEPDPLSEFGEAPPELAPAPPPPVWFEPGEFEAMVPRALVDLGLSANPVSAPPCERATNVASFTAWSGFVDASHERWIDLVLEIDSDAAAVVYERALRRRTESPKEIAGFLAEIQAVLNATAKAALQTKGCDILSPLLSRAEKRDLWEPALRIPAESLFFRFDMEGVNVDLAVVCYPCTAEERESWQLQPNEILAEAYPPGTATGAPLLPRGIALNTHTIHQAQDHSDACFEPPSLRVYPPSPMAQRFHRPPSQRPGL